MKNERRNPRSFGILTALFLMLIISLAGCEKGTLGLKGGSISGTVLDSETYVGVSGVNVRAEAGIEQSKVTRYTSSDSNGNYYFNDMRADEWTITFDKAGFVPIDVDASNTVKVVVENSENVTVHEVRMERTIENQYVTIRGTLKDAVNGTLITYGNANFVFGKTSFGNRLPTEFETGFRIPATIAPIDVTISVAGYQNYTVQLPSARTDIDLSVVMLQPVTYSIVGHWRDVPGWVFQDAPRADIFAYAGNRIVATATGQLNEQQFIINGIPKGTSVSIEAEIKGYRMNGPIVVHPNGDFQGTIYQIFSLKNNFSQIMRDVRVIVSGNGIASGDYVGAYCNETGTTWAQTIVSNPPGFTVGTPRVIDLGTNQLPTGYNFTFSGYIVGNGTISTTSGIFINDDGADPQIVTIQVN